MPYGPVVLEHFRRPRNLGTLVHPTVTGEAHNPLCGDHVRIELEIMTDAIRSVAFTANACAICTASASVLTERLTGAPVVSLLEITDADAVAALQANIPTARVPCATLPLQAARRAVDEYRSNA